MSDSPIQPRTEQPGEPDPPVADASHAAADGGGYAASELLPLVYQQLRDLAGQRMAGERVGHTLQATALVNEAYVRLISGNAAPWASQKQFFFAAAEAMRRILIDHARARDGPKRGGNWKKVPLNCVLDLASAEHDPAQIMALDEAISRLEQVSAIVASVVRLRFYAGLTVDETAQTLGVSPRTVKREWTYGRAWLARELGVRGNVMAIEDQQDGGAALREILDRAAALPADQRAGFLDEACGTNAELRREVESLLVALDSAENLLRAPTVGVTDIEGSALHEGPGTRIGRYKLLQQIGEGGMGVVFMAEQEYPVRRMVAVKVIKLGMDTKLVVARFEAERQALAMMDHANIAKVLDAGVTETGRPYFVMELVRGIPITEYCDQNKLAPRERLELFVQVCNAVQHAHAKGIVHRDLKPTNVLVTLQDDKPMPKVIDFGIAKAMGGQRLTERTLFTELRQLPGTPLYMSPEQAEMNAVQDVDTRSDVYSLGVLLYELLTGTTPFDKQRLAQAAYDEIRRIIREEEPPRPSTRLSTLGATLATVSAQRHTDADRLGRIVRGELDWIVMRTLEKDRARRYQTANGLARDVERYLADEPVEACPPSRLYRVRKFARRNKTALATAMVLIVILATAATISTFQAVRAKREAIKKGQVADFLGMTLRHLTPAYGHDLAQTVDDAAAHIDEQLGGQPDIEANVRAVLGWNYFKLELFDKAEVQLRKALAATDKGHQSFAEIERALGLTLQSRNKFDEAEVMYRQAFAIESDRSDDENAIGTLTSLASLLQMRGRLVEADSVLQQGLAIDRRHFLRNDKHLWLPNSVLGGLRFDEGKYADSEQFCRDAVQDMREQPDHLRWTLYFFYRALREEGKLDEAERTANKLLSINLSLFAPEHLEIGRATYAIADVLQEKGKLDEAEHGYQRVLAIWKKTLPADHPLNAMCLDHLGTLRCEQGRLSDAEELIRGGLKMRQKIFGAEHPDVTLSLNNLGVVLHAQGKLAEAEANLREAVGLRRKLLGEEHPYLAISLVELSSVLVDEGKAAEAEQIVRQAISIQQKGLPAEHWRQAESASLLGETLADQKKLAEAEPLLLRGHDTMKKNPYAPQSRRRQAIARLIHFYQASNNVPETAKFQSEMDVLTAHSATEPVTMPLHSPN